MLNLSITICGWFAFNAIMFSIAKDAEFDKPGELKWKDLVYYISQYTIRTCDNWFASLWMVPIVLFLGYKSLGLNALGVVDTEHLGWSDLYYPGVGFLTEFLMVLYKRWKRRNK